MSQLACLHCGHIDDFEGDAANDVIRCDQCGGMVAFGVRQPRVTLEPTGDPRFLFVRIDSIAIPLLRDFARAIAVEILSVCPEPVPTVPSPPAEQPSEAVAELQ